MPNYFNGTTFQVTVSKTYSKNILKTIVTFFLYFVNTNLVYIPILEELNESKLSDNNSKILNITNINDVNNSSIHIDNKNNGSILNTNININGSVFRTSFCLLYI